MRVDRVYKFGCKAPDHLELAEQMLGQAWLYQDALRRVYNDNTRKRRALSQATDRQTEHVLAFERARLDDNAHALLYESRMLRNIPSYEVLHEELNLHICMARKRRGPLVDHGTYWLVEKAMKIAAKDSGMDPIKRKDWDGSGRIGAAIQSSEHFPADAWKHDRVSLTRELEADSQENQRERKNRSAAEKRAKVVILIGALKKQIALAWDVKLHRAFPEGAIVKQVAVQRIRNGYRYRWELLVTLSFESPVRDLDASGVVGIDVGWRSEGQQPSPWKDAKSLIGIRVATHDAEDDRGDLHIDTEKSFLYSDAVRMIRDRSFDVAKERAKRAGFEGTTHAHLWRDKNRLHQVSRKFFPLRTAANPQITTPIEGPPRLEEHDLNEWQHTDRHLEEIECGVRSRAMRRRLYKMRAYADELAKCYQYVSLEDMAMRDWVSTGKTEKLERKRSMAAVSLFQEAIAHRFGPSRTYWVKAAYSSMTCASCGEVRTSKVGPVVKWICTCGKEHHQDYNAAQNLRVLCERLLDEQTLPGARTRKALKKGKKKEQNGIGTGDHLRIVVTARKAISKVA